MDLLLHPLWIRTYIIRRILVSDTNTHHFTILLIMCATDFSTARRPMSFIIIDDDKISNFVCKFTLLKKDKKADIQLFTDPEIALASIGETIIRTGNYSKTILLLDINMPLMSGWEFLDNFSKFGDTICSQFTIYMFSSSIDVADIERSELNVLVSAMLSKPLSPVDLQTIWGNDNIYLQVSD